MSGTIKHIDCCVSELLIDGRSRGTCPQQRGLPLNQFGYRLRGTDGALNRIAKVVIDKLRGGALPIGQPSENRVIFNKSKQETVVVKGSISPSSTLAVTQFMRS